MGWGNKILKTRVKTMCSSGIDIHCPTKKSLKIPKG
jgi:hypothetical protein